MIKIKSVGIASKILFIINFNIAQFSDPHNKRKQAERFLAKFAKILKNRTA
ncbi:hypothetical protein HPSSW114_0561 [Glaesserella parasuis SW114]|nr:hypothetical protein HPSSW114_0561 [Glaesserella parasuis SW114]